jgi:cobalamin biosynthesis Co2+ chelatase CbiK
MEIADVLNQALAVLKRVNDEDEDRKIFNAYISDDVIESIKNLENKLKELDGNTTN